MSESMKKAARLGAVSGGATIAAAILLGLCPVSATASTVTLDFGVIGADGGAACGGKCVLPTTAEHTFSAGGATVGAIGYDASGAIAYVTQKPGAFAALGGETGLGESDTFPHPSTSDYEVTRATWLLIDNAAAFAAGYKSSTFSIESLQNGEGANIYAYTGPLTALDTSDLTLLATVSAPLTGGVTQTISVPNNSLYLVVQAYAPPHGNRNADIVVAEEVLDTKPVIGGPAPEPGTWAMMLAGVAGVGATVRRRAKAAAAA